MSTVSGQVLCSACQESFWSGRIQDNRGGQILGGNLKLHQDLMLSLGIQLDTGTEEKQMTVIPCGRGQPSSSTDGNTLTGNQF